jgi:hypothetical protein
MYCGYARPHQKKSPLLLENGKKDSRDGGRKIRSRKNRNL